MDTDELIKQRGNDYGHPRPEFEKVSKLWSVIIGSEVTPEQIPLCMIALKMVREMHKHKDDNLYDIKGYTKTLEMMYELDTETKSNNLT